MEKRLQTRGRKSNTTIKGITERTRNNGTVYEARVTIPTTKSFNVKTIYLGCSKTIGGAISMRNNFIKSLF